VPSSVETISYATPYFGSVLVFTNLPRPHASVMSQVADFYKSGKRQ
jgi:hypothetical protein